MCNILPITQRFFNLFQLKSFSAFRELNLLEAFIHLIII